MNRIWRCRIGFLTLSMVLLLLASTAFVWQPNGGNVPPPTRDASVSREELQTLYISTAEPLNEEQQILYNSTVKMLLKEDLWTERDMYDAVHYLMIPMHYAFRAGDEGTVSLFADFFTRFTQDITTDDRYGFQTSIFLNRLQFYYFSTQFMCLCAASGRVDLIPDALPAAAYDCAETYLLHTEANWHTEDTVIEHLRQMLAGKEYPYSYYSVTEDLDGFTLAILCDLNCFAKLSGKEPEELTVTAAQLVYEYTPLRFLIRKRNLAAGCCKLAPGRSTRIMRMRETRRSHRIFSQRRGMMFLGIPRILQGGLCTCAVICRPRPIMSTGTCLCSAASSWLIRWSIMF